MTSISANPSIRGDGRTHDAAALPPISVRREGHGWVLETELWLPRPRSEVFPFFADAHNLEILTPPLLNFNVITPRPIEMRTGALIDYKLRIRGVPVRWRTEIAVWEPDTKFVDQQLKGPYKKWHHTHTFEDRDGGTLCGDRVEYEVPGGPLAPLVNKLAVQRDVEAIFRFRAKKMRELFGTTA